MPKLSAKTKSSPKSPAGKPVSTHRGESASPRGESASVGETRMYELTLVLSSAIKPEKREAVVGAVKKLIAAQKGSVQRVDEWGLRDLAYAIKKQLSGWYAQFFISLPPAAVNNVETRIRQNEQILRHLLIRREE